MEGCGDLGGGGGGGEGEGRALSHPAVQTIKHLFYFLDWWQRSL